jgi:hypothetical protein
MHNNEPSEFMITSMSFALDDGLDRRESIKYRKPSVKMYFTARILSGKSELYSEHHFEGYYVTREKLINYYIKN